MKLTIESTTKVVTLETPQGSVPARIWEGHTESGIPVHCYITHVGVMGSEDLSQFSRELAEQQEPSPAIEAIPLRLIL